MKIAIDMDGVLYNSEEYYRAYAELYDLEIKGGGVINQKSIRIQHRFNWTKEQVHDFCAKYVPYVAKNSALKPLAKEVIDFLHKKGHTLIAVTTRGEQFEIEKKITQKRLKKEGIKFDKIYFSCPNKDEICEKENVDYVIEDYLENVKKISSRGIKTIYFKDYADGEDCKDKNIIQVENWGEIYRFFFNK